MVRTNELGFLLALARKKRGLSQQEVGGGIGVSSQAISAYECGRRVPKGVVLEKLAALLGIDLDADVQKLCVERKRKMAKIGHLDPVRFLLTRGIENAPPDRVSEVAEAGRVVLDVYGRFLDLLYDLEVLSH
ncbi:helix-turn-helix transcriptional regulator [Patescibacteria group bacterium]|nr:helix-turn-helix transcriptional regulator [Patescibacteria group bacterium]